MSEETQVGHGDTGATPVTSRGEVQARAVRAHPSPAEREKTLRAVIGSNRVLLEKAEERRKEYAQILETARKRVADHEAAIAAAPGLIEAAERELRLVTENADLLRAAERVRKALAKAEHGERVEEIKERGRKEGEARRAAARSAG